MFWELIITSEKYDALSVTINGDDWGPKLPSTCFNAVWRLEVSNLGAVKSVYIYENGNSFFF